MSKSLFIDRRLGDMDPVETLEFEPMIIKTVNGEMVASAVAELDDDTLVLSMPFSMVPMFDDEDGFVVGFNLAKYCPGSDDAFFLLPTSQVLSMGSMCASYFESYEKAVDKQLDSWTETISEMEAAEANLEEGSDKVVAFKKPTLLH